MLKCELQRPCSLSTTTTSSVTSDLSVANDLEFQIILISLVTTDSGELCKDFSIKKNQSVVLTASKQQSVVIILTFVPVYCDLIHFDLIYQRFFCSIVFISVMRLRISSLGVRTKTASYTAYSLSAQPASFDNHWYYNGSILMRSFITNGSTGDLISRTLISLFILALYPIHVATLPTRNQTLNTPTSVTTTSIELFLNSVANISTPTIAMDNSVITSSNRINSHPPTDIPSTISDPFRKKSFQPGIRNDSIVYTSDNIPITNPSSVTSRKTTRLHADLMSSTMNANNSNRPNSVTVQKHSIPPNVFPSSKEKSTGIVEIYITPRNTTLYMRSERTRRSLEYIMFTQEVLPSYLFNIHLNGIQEASVLTLTVDGQLGFTYRIHHQQAKLSISVIVEKSQLTDEKNQLSLRDDSAVILRRYNSNVCICMTPELVITSELIINQTISDNCEWRLRISRHGMGFEHLISEDVSKSTNEIPLRIDSKRRKPRTKIDRFNIGEQRRIHSRRATLAVKWNGKKAYLTSGWQYRLWDPFTIWMLTSEVRRTNDTLIRKEPNELVSDTKQQQQQQVRVPSNNSRLRIGDREVYSMDAKPRDIQQLYLGEQESYCLGLRSNLTNTVYQEMQMSFRVLNYMLRVARQLEDRLRVQNVATGTITTPVFVFFDRWMDVSYKRRLHRIHEGIRTRGIHSMLRCSLSLEDEFQLLTQDKDDYTHIYLDMYLRLKHLASWNETEKLEWIARPKLTTLLKFLNVPFPPITKLRQASFILHRYITPYIVRKPLRSDHTSNNKPSLLSIRSKYHRYAYIRKSLRRASLLKFEELQFWPRLLQRTTGKQIRHSIIGADELNKELMKLPTRSKCFENFLSKWRAQRAMDSPGACSIEITRKQRPRTRNPRIIRSTPNSVHPEAAKTISFTSVGSNPL